MTTLATKPLLFSSLPRTKRDRPSVEEVDRGIYPAELAERCKADAGKPYRPSNGTEGEVFFSAYCSDCTKSQREEPCSIEGAAMFNRITDPDYPKQWIYGKDGQPKCTAFRQSKKVRHD